MRTGAAHTAYTVGCTAIEPWHGRSAKPRADGRAGGSPHLHLPKVAEEQLVLIPLAMPALSVHSQ